MSNNMINRIEAFQMVSQRKKGSVMDDYCDHHKVTSNNRNNSRYIIQLQ